MLAPIFDEAAESVKKDFPQAGKVVLGKVDCDSETAVSNQYQISKYPTLKLFRDGQMMKKVGVRIREIVMIVINNNRPYTFNSGGTTKASGKPEG